MPTITPTPVTGRPVFTVELDADGDGSYGTELDWMEASWENGHQDAYQAISYAPRPSIVLKNADGRYSPERAEALAGLERGRRVRIRAAWESTYYTLWVGEITAIKPQAGQYGQRRTVIEAAGWLERAQRQDRLRVAVQADKRADEIITALVEASGIYPPAYDGTPGSWGDLEEGQTVFPLVLDDLDDTTTLYEALRRVVEGEGLPARLSQTRDGRARFIDRHYLVAATSQFSIDNEMHELDYRYGETLANRVALTINPRRRDTDGAPYVLHRTSRAQVIRAWSDLIFQLRYADEYGNPLSTTMPITPVPYVDYEVNRAEDGSGEDITPSITVQAEHYGNSSQWKVSGVGGADGYLLAGATQRGNDRITSYGRQSIEVEDAASQAAYGILPLSLNTDLMPDVEVGRQYALYVLQVRSQPRGEARVLTVKPYRSKALMENLLTHSPDNMTRLTVRETQTGAEGDYYWVGERWMLRPTDLDVEMVLEPAGAFDSYIIFGPGGRSTFDAGYVFGY